MGPVIATIVYRWFGYIGTLGFFAGMIFVVTLPCALMIPSRIDKVNEDKDGKKEIIDIDWKVLFRNKRFNLVMFACVVVALILTFTDPTLSLRL